MIAKLKIINDAIITPIGIKITFIKSMLKLKLPKKIISRNNSSEYVAGIMFEIICKLSGRTVIGYMTPENNEISTFER